MPDRTTKNGKTKLTAEAAIRDRIKEFRRVPSDELHDNPRNWRTHPFAQSEALKEILDRVGIAGAVLAYHSERNGGRLTLIDGHERKSHQADWPTLILDVDDDEADLILATYDPITALASTDGEQLKSLLEDVQFGTPALEDLLHGLAQQARKEGEEGPDDAAEDGGGRKKVQADGEWDGPPDMELLPFEHYDYVVLLYRNSLDWLAAQDLLGIKDVTYSLKDGRRPHVGRGRVIDGKRVLEMLRKAQ